jgi:hypothetical protein
VPRRFVHPGPGQRVPIGDLIIVVEISKMVVCLEVCPRERNLAFHQIRVRLHFFNVMSKWHKSEKRDRSRLRIVNVEAVMKKR